MNRFHFSWLLSVVIGAFQVAFGAESAGLVEKPFAPATNPPPIQMLAPGFTVRELPLQLNNLNNLVYAPDGRLFALGYDGNVFQLKDTNGDGLEDTATHFFKNDRNEILPSIGMTWGPGGLYIASRGRVIRLRDRGDGTGDLETIASGWVPPTKAAGSSLDAVGIVVDAAGNIYFGLGCDAWSEAYRVNKETGQSDYNINSERGTILKLSPDWKKREAIATGLRFTVSLAFNAAGDLFCTDQEGATWLPNGNPFDELLHIQPGRHYGFPPRHPKYLPGVIDEPSVFDFGPQHQSTCGLHFNEPVAGNGNVFGPAWWRGDAIIAGESRGKIWRTKLLKTAAGYVAHTGLIACLSLLTIDAVPTPQGDLLVACHTGKPDWGTGPQGKGKLFKISYTDKVIPQPVLAYAASPTETRIVFDRPLDPTQFKNLVKQSGLTVGKYVSAGDRFESFVPGYQAVKDQKPAPRSGLKVLSAGVTADNRSLVLQTAPRTEAVNYAVMLPRPSGVTAADGLLSPIRNGTEPPHVGSDQEIDLLSDLTGVEADWTDTAGPTSWSGWLPHLDLAVAQEFAAVSAEHARMFALLKTPGTLRLRAQLDLWLMLRTAIQPGAKLDFEYPTETVTLVLKAGATLNFSAAAKTKVQRVSDREWHVTTESKQDQWLPLEISLSTGAKEPKLEVSWFTAEDPRPRALPFRRILLPWATPKAAESPGVTERRIPEIAGGDWQRGKQVFFSEQAACSKCHQAGGAGGKIGPDMSNLVYRDYASVMKDITQPSAALNPEHLAYNVELNDGDSLNGVILADTPETIVLGQVTGQNITVTKSRIARMKASSVSLMPEGLLQALNAQQQRDLLAFLLTAPPNDKTN
jgi:putative heme-binding domain-containing protein